LPALLLPSPPSASGPAAEPLPGSSPEPPSDRAAALEPESCGARPVEFLKNFIKIAFAKFVLLPYGRRCAETGR
jgi:hypothetical protein